MSSRGEKCYESSIVQMTLDEGVQGLYVMGQLPISCQTVESSSKPALINPEVLQKEH